MQSGRNAKYTMQTAIGKMTVILPFAVCIVYFAFSRKHLLPRPLRRRRHRVFLLRRRLAQADGVAILERVGQAHLRERRRRLAGRHRRGLRRGGRTGPRSGRRARRGRAPASPAPAAAPAGSRPAPAGARGRRRGTAAPAAARAASPPAAIRRAAAAAAAAAPCGCAGRRGTCPWLGGSGTDGCSSPGAPGRCLGTGVTFSSAAGACSAGGNSFASSCPPLSSGKRKPSPGSSFFASSFAGASSALARTTAARLRVLRDGRRRAVGRSRRGTAAGRR